MLGPLRAKVNLIFFNPFPGAEFAPSPRARVEAFQALLHRGNLTATIRESRGRDIAAACGQLFAEHDGDGRAHAPAQNAAQVPEDAVDG
jgi:23S rRNA (adenine2503-C2)-methyltransferase